MAIRAIVFDIGGVLEVNPETGWQAKWERRLQRPLREIFEQLRRLGIDGSLGTCSEDAWVNSLRDVTGMDAEQTAEFMADLWLWYLGTPNIELTTFFAGLRPQYQTALLSNSFVGARAREQEKYHFHQLTDQMIYSHEVGLAKPDRRIYALTCHRLNVHPSEVIFLDDAQINVTAALEYGMHGILFQDNAQAIADIQALLLANSQ